MRKRTRWNDHVGDAAHLLARMEQIGTLRGIRSARNSSKPSSDPSVGGGAGSHYSKSGRVT